MKKTRKILAIVCALTLTAALTVGGTLAYLADKTDEITNTFTVGNVDIDLTETNVDGDSALANAYKMVPGNEIAKDPKVTVDADSEACWLFVQIDKSAVLDNYIAYTVADGWTALTDVDGVYYRVVSDTDADQDFAVLKDNKVAVKGEVTQKMMDDLKVAGATQPTLTFTAYAVQQANIATAADAWAQVNNAANFPATAG